MSKQVWEPVPDGLYEQESCIAMRVMNNGVTLWQVDKILDSSNKIYLSNDVRLCRLVAAQDAPQGEAMDLEREMLAMIDELLVLAHRPEHSWDEKDYELRDRIAARHTEMVAQLKDSPAPAEPLPETLPLFEMGQSDD